MLHIARGGRRSSGGATNSVSLSRARAPSLPRAFGCSGAVLGSRRKRCEKRWCVPRRRPWRLRTGPSKCWEAVLCTPAAVKTKLACLLVSYMPLASRVARGPYELFRGLSTSKQRTRHHCDGGRGTSESVASPGRPLCRIARAAPGGDAGATRRVRPSGAPQTGKLLLRRAELRH